MRHTHLYHLVKCLSRFHLFEFTALQMQVSFVSIGRRGSSGLRFGSKALVHCRRASHPKECRSLTHATYPSHCSPHGPFQATHSLVKGRTTQDSIWRPAFFFSCAKIRGRDARKYIQSVAFLTHQGFARTSDILTHDENGYLIARFP